MLPEITAEDFASVLDHVAAEGLASATVSGPPVDARGVAAAQGVVVALDEKQAGRARYVRLTGARPRATRNPLEAAIFIRSEPRPERQQWSIAHELGEHWAFRVFLLLGIDPHEAPPAMREHTANALASRLLLPSAWLARDGAALDWDLVQLKQRYATASHELIARRMVELRPAAIVTIIDQGRLTYRRRGQGPVASWLPIERATWLETHEHSRVTERVEGALRARAWPIHEPTWKREILVCEPVNDDEAGQDFVDGECSSRAGWSADTED